MLVAENKNLVFETRIYNVFVYFINKNKCTEFIYLFHKHVLIFISL